MDYAMLAWLIIGRRRRHHSRSTGPDRATDAVPAYDRTGLFAPTDPAASAFLQQCRERAEHQRRIADIERRRRESDTD